MANLGKVIYINEEDYSTLLNGGSVTKGGTTYTYDSTALYVIKNVSAPEYAETAGYASTAGQATQALQDGGGNVIIDTYDKKPLVIEVNDTDTSVPSGTYASIAAAIAADRDVFVKVTMTESDGEVLYLPIVKDYSSIDAEYYFETSFEGFFWSEIINSRDGLSFSTFQACDENHGHGNITRLGGLQTTDITIANGDKLVVTDASNANKVARASLTFDGSTTTQALSKKGTWETFAKPTMVVTITRSGTAPNYTYTANKTYAEIGAALEAGTNVVLVQNNYYYWFYAKGSGNTPDLVFKSVSNADWQPVSDGSINYIQSYRITINSSNTLTLSSDIIDLTGKVDKVTSTDNAIARFDGTGGQIQNSGVTINDSNHVTAAKFITSGGTSNQFLKGDGSLDSGPYVKFNDYVSPFNNWYLNADTRFKKFFHSQLDNIIYAFNLRYTVTHKIYDVSDDSFKRDASITIYDGSWGSGGSNVFDGEYAELYMGVSDEATMLDDIASSTSFNTYPSGFVVLTFYYGTNMTDNPIVYYTAKDLTWTQLTVTKGSQYTYYATVPGTKNYIKAFKIRYNGMGTTGDHCTKLCQLEYFIFRGNISQAAGVNKYPVAQNLYGNVTAPKFITRGGTSAQFVKGDGTLDSTSTAANSLLSSLPDWTATPTDTTKLVRRDTGGSASFGQITFLTVWNYIKSKISSVLGIGGDNGIPTAPTAASGTNTTQVATTAFVQNALSNMGAGGSEMVDVTITGTTSAASFSANPYNAIKAVVDDGKIAVLNASVAPLSTTGVLIPVYEYTYSQSGSDFTGYKGKIQNGNYEISVDVQSTSSATVSITSVGSSITVDTALSESSTNPVQNRVITAQILENEEIVATALNNLNDRVELKQDQLVSGTTIKTINNQSILGSGNISISGGGGGGGGEENVIEVVKVNGTALTPDANKAVNVQALTGVTVGNTALTPSNGVITIGVDAAPTANSTNVVLSSGIKSYVDGRRVVYNISFGGEEVVIDDVTYYGIVNHALADAIIADVTAGKEVILADGDGGYNRLDSVLWGMYLFNTGGVKGYDFIVVSDTSSFQGYNILYRYATSYQERLVSGTNIKTVNNNSLLGSGNISVGTYSKPSGGIPATDLASAVQTSLGKADTSLQPDVDNDLGQGTISSSNSQGFNYIIADKDTSSEQTLQDALDAKASTSAVNAKYTKPSGGIPDTDLTTAVNVRLLAQLSSSSDDGKIMKYSYSGGGWQAVKPVTIYSGSSAPSSSTGSNGDIYIQTS